MDGIQIRKVGLALLASCLTLSAGCSPVVRSATFLEVPPRAPDEPVRLYGETRPDCSYEEVGTVQVTKRNVFVSMEEVTEALRDQARAMGGDAVIGVTQLGGESATGTAGGDVVAVGVKPALSGTVIRFTQEDCRS